MTNLKQAPPPDDPAYENIRYVSRELAYIVDELTFEPLYNKHTKVLSVSALIPQTEEGDFRLTMWHGFRDGQGKDGSATGFWVRSDQKTAGRRENEILPMDPEHPGAGLKHPPGIAEDVRKAVATMYELLTIAEEAHRGLVGIARQRSFGQLNDAVDVGVGGGYDIEEYDAEDDTDPVDLLQTLCEECDMYAIRFGNLIRSEGSFFASMGILDIEGVPVEMTLWSEVAEKDDRTWLLLAGDIQQLPREGTDDSELQWPDEDDETNDWLAAACEELLEIHRVAAAIFSDVTAGGVSSAYSLLTAVAGAAAADDANEEGLALNTFLTNLQEAAAQHEPEAEHQEHLHSHEPANMPHVDWHDSVDSFTKQCRYGWLYGITVEESPYGAANVSALIRPPGLEDKKMVSVKVFTHQGELETQPGHWFSADDVMCPAHGKDVDIAGLVSAFPVKSQAYIAHALQHLHTMNHTVEDILEGKLKDVVEYLEPVVDNEDDLRDMSRILYASEFVDTLAGLNGIARIHTGSFPQDKA